MSSLGVLRGGRDRPQRPSPGSEHRELRRAHLPHALVTPRPSDEAASRHPSARERGRSPDPSSLSSDWALPSANFSGMGSTRSCHCREENRPRRRPGPGRPAHGNVRDSRRRASPRGDDERDAVVPTSLLTSFTGSFTRNACTRAESRTRPTSTPPKGWPTSLTSTPRGAGSSAGRLPRR